MLSLSLTHTGTRGRYGRSVDRNPHPSESSRATRGNESLGEKFLTGANATTQALVLRATSASLCSR